MHVCALASKFETYTTTLGHQRNPLRVNERGERNNSKLEMNMIELASTKKLIKTLHCNEHFSKVFMEQ